jgi:hypothetical protein
MKIEEFQALKAKELDNLIPARKIAYEKGDALRIAENGQFLDLLSFYNGVWHYITTYKKSK